VSLQGFHLTKNKRLSAINAVANGGEVLERDAVMQMEKALSTPAPSTDATSKHNYYNN
jgi:hypothetical protein